MYELHLFFAHSNTQPNFGGLTALYTDHSAALTGALYCRIDQSGPLLMAQTGQLTSVH